MDFDRTKNAKRTIVSSLILKLLTILVPFLMRTIIIYTLGNLYLGLGSLFSSILNTLSLAELGIGSALIFSMYKPVAENEIDKVCALLNVYKKIYYIIGLAILIIGLILIPFLNSFIKGDYPEEINIYFLYIMQLISTVAGYFFLAYRGSVLTAYQRTDVLNLVNFVADMIMYALQIISLLVFRNYYLYVFVMLVKCIIYNLVISRIVSVKYPNLIAKGKIDKETEKQIIKKTGALTGHKIAEVVINSTDNILISMILGLNMVTIYNNYFYIITALSGVVLLVFSGLNSIVGNYLITKDGESIYSLFGTLNYINAFIIVVCSTCLINVYQPFMTIWTGDENVMPMYIVLLFAAYFYTLRIRTVMMLFQNAAGIWEKDLIKAYVMTLLNLVIDIILMPKIGVGSALISTIISMVFAFVYEMIVVHKYVLKRSAIKYFFLNIIYLISALFACFCSYYICCSFNRLNIWLNMISSGLISALIAMVCFIGLTFWCKESKDSYFFIISKIKKKN